MVIKEASHKQKTKNTPATQTPLLLYQQIGQTPKFVGIKKTVHNLFLLRFLEQASQQFSVTLSLATKTAFNIKRHLPEAQYDTTNGLILK